MDEYGGDDEDDTQDNQPLAALPDKLILCGYTFTREHLHLVKCWLDAACSQPVSPPLKAPYPQNMKTDRAAYMQAGT